MLYDLLAVFLVQLLDKVDGIVGVEDVDKLADLLRIHMFEEFLAVFLVHFHKHIGLFLLVFDKVEEPLGLLQVQLAQNLGYIGRMQVGDLLEDAVVVAPSTIASILSISS